MFQTSGNETFRATCPHKVFKPNTTYWDCCSRTLVLTFALLNQTISTSVIYLFIYLFIYYTVYTHVKSFTIVKNRKLLLPWGTFTPMLVFLWLFVLSAAAW